MRSDQFSLGVGVGARHVVAAVVGNVVVWAVLGRGLAGVAVVAVVVVVVVVVVAAGGAVSGVAAVTKKCELCRRTFTVYGGSLQQAARKYCGSNCADRASELSRLGRPMVDPGYMRKPRQLTRIERSISELEKFSAFDSTGMAEQLEPALRMLKAARADLTEEADRARTEQRCS